MSRTPGTRKKEHTLYRFWGANDVLLYIGIAGDPVSRWRQHSEDKDWWRQVERITVEHFDTRRAVEVAESVAISTEHPRHNVHHRIKDPVPADVPAPLDGPPTTEAEYIALVSRVARVGAPLPEGEFSIYRNHMTGERVVSYYTGPGQLVESSSGGWKLRQPSVEIAISEERDWELRNMRVREPSRP